MTRARKITAAWSELPADELAEQVRHMVKARDAATRAVWSAVRENHVLTARVRGALAAVKAEFRGHRDEAMWLLWISQVQQQLAATAEPASAPVVEVVDVVEDEVVVELPVVELPVIAPRVETTVRRPPVQVPSVLFQEPQHS